MRGGALTGDGDVPESRDFLRVLCHEFRTPVASVQALARALAGDASRLSTSQRVEAARLIAGHAEHLAAMLDAVRTVAEHLPAAATPSRPTTVQVADLISGAADAAGVTVLDLQIAASVAAVAVDVPSVRRILTNLLENARRHGREPIVVRVERCSDGLLVIAADHGPGMPSDVAARAFLGGPPPTEGSHGLGLWIVTQLAAMLGGSVRACANRPTGTRVEVTLPLHA